jgi:glycopeptide antibiotics resistance protein
LTAAPSDAPYGRGHLAASLLALYLVTVAFIVLWPSPVDQQVQGTLARMLIRLHAFGAPDWIDYNLVEASANIAMFVPIGLLAGIQLREGLRWLALPGAFVVSFLIELFQDSFLPGRFGTMQDVLANTHGAAVGLVILYAALEHRRTRKTAPSDTPKR